MVKEQKKNHQNRKFSSIRRSIFITMTIIVISLITLGFVVYYMKKQDIESKITVTIKSVGKNTARAMDEFMIDSYQKLGLVSKSSTLRKGVQEAQYGVEKYNKTFSIFDSIVYLDTNGEIISYSKQPLLTDGEQNIKDATSRWFEEFTSSNKKVLSPLAYAGDFKRYFVFYHKIENKNGETIGHLFGQMNSEILAQYSKSVKIGQTG